MNCPACGLPDNAHDPVFHNKMVVIADEVSVGLVDVAFLLSKSAYDLLVRMGVTPVPSLQDRADGNYLVDVDKLQDLVRDNGFVDRVMTTMVQLAGPNDWNWPLGAIRVTQHAVPGYRMLADLAATWKFGTGNKTFPELLHEQTKAYRVKVARAVAGSANDAGMHRCVIVPIPRDQEVFLNPTAVGVTPPTSPACAPLTKLEPLWVDVVRIDLNDDMNVRLCKPRKPMPYEDGVPEFEIAQYSAARGNYVVRSQLVKSSMFQEWEVRLDYAPNKNEDGDLVAQKVPW